METKFIIETTVDITNHIKVSKENRIAYGQKQNYMADLFIDCSGFTGFLLKKELEVPYVSYKKYLPLDRAFAFPTAKEKEFNAWTLSRALNYGWN